MPNTDLMQKIKYGDIKKVAEITGLHINTVRNQLKQEDMRSDVIDAFIIIFNKRDYQKRRLLKKLSK